jgi:hypothetical protein
MRPTTVGVTILFEGAGVPLQPSLAVQGPRQPSFALHSALLSLIITSSTALSPSEIAAGNMVIVNTGEASTFDGAVPLVTPQSEQSPASQPPTANTKNDSTRAIAKRPLNVATAALLISYRFHLR